MLTLRLPRGQLPHPLSIEVCFPTRPIPYWRDIVDDRKLSPPLSFSLEGERKFVIHWLETTVTLVFLST
jgi:hypothetical protein